MQKHTYYYIIALSNDANPSIFIALKKGKLCAKVMRAYYSRASLLSDLTSLNRD